MFPPIIIDWVMDISATVGSRNFARLIRIPSGVRVSVRDIVSSFVAKISHARWVEIRGQRSDIAFEWRHFNRFILTGKCTTGKLINVPGIDAVKTAGGRFREVILPAIRSVILQRSPVAIVTKFQRRAIKHFGFADIVWIEFTQTYKRCDRLLGSPRRLRRITKIDVLNAIASTCALRQKSIVIAGVHNQPYRVMAEVVEALGPFRPLLGRR